MKSMLVGAYLLVCILAGGSSQVMWTNLLLQVLGVFLIAWAALSRRGATVENRADLPLKMLIGAGLVIVLLQLIPLPSSVWSSLPGRESIASGYATLRQPLPALPVSETPFVSVSVLFAIIPAVAMVVAVENLRPSPRVLAAAIVLGLAMGIALGSIQAADGPFSSAYLYKITNPGAVGFFANRNHMATLLLIGIPMATALAASGKTGGSHGMAVAFLVVIGVGVVLNSSIVAYALIIPVALASAASLPTAVNLRKFALPAAMLAIVAAVAFLISKPVAGSLDSNVMRAMDGRTEIWTRTMEAIAANFPVGTGLGSFAQIYRQYEDPVEVGRFYVNHAHNDYLEIILEMGGGGALLLLLFLAWWGILACRVWTSRLSTPFARAATIASAVVIVHSLVDFPLRTAAISAIFATCIALMAQHSRHTTLPVESGLRSTRHVKLG